MLHRAVERGRLAPDIDIVAQIFPAYAYQRAAALGMLVGDHDVTRVVDAVLLPALGSSH